MIKSKHIDLLCIGAAVMAAVLVLVWMAGLSQGIFSTNAQPEYVFRLFDDSRVHTLDLQVEDWELFLQDASKEEYVSCKVEIDGELFSSVGLRAKGNNSLRLTQEYGLSRYSMKLEFDHFLKGGNYHGLDKFSLDASFQDNTYLKTYLAYDMMRFMEVPTPLCSYVWVTVNQVPWGLFLAIEEPEEAFARRCFGRNHGELYKPDYQSLQAENPDVALRYVDDDPKSYQNIFENAKFKTSPGDQQRLIQALKILSTGEDLEEAVDIEEVLRYFVVQVFLMNWDSYLGRTGHNYFLYEEEGILSMLPWDYNLAFGTYALGMTDPIRDPTVLINYPIYTPAPGEVMKNRPLYHNLMKQKEYFSQYQDYFRRFLTEYLDSGRLETALRKTEQLIFPYVQEDPTRFCSLKDHQKAVDTLEAVCLLRGKSVKAQLAGKVPPTLRGQKENPKARIDASSLDLRQLGDFEDLKTARRGQEQALSKVMEGK